MFDADSENELTDLADSLTAEANRIAADCGLDSVLIIATHTRPDGTTCRTNGTAGNWYASYGAAINWIKAEDSDPDTERESDSE